MRKYLTLVSILLFANIASSESSQFKYKLKILKKEDGFLGCFGDNCESSCSHNLYIMENSSLSFPCNAEEKINKFTERYIYVFLKGRDYYVCPSKAYLKTDCLICRECSFKEDQIQKMNIK